MSDPEAMVHLELERRNVPFSWRWFDGDSPHLREMLPDYAPEFTLREYRLVFTVAGAFFSGIPGVFDRMALAAVLLEADGWRLEVLYDADIRKGVGQAIDAVAPELVRPSVVGPPRPNPLGNVDLMRRLRERLSAYAMFRRKYFDSEDQEVINDRRRNSSGRRARRSNSRRRAVYRQRD
jgi:hypothetical protein